MSSNIEASSSSSSSSAIEEPRNWLELPHDITLSILMKLECSAILETAQFVCKLWYDFCKHPSMWRTIVMHNLDEPELAKRHQKMLYSAVDRSAGGLVKVDIEGFGCNDLIAYIGERAGQLKHLRLACCYSISSEALIEALRKLPLLQEVELTLCWFTVAQTVDIIHCCPSLKTLKLNDLGSEDPALACDDEALVIAERMRGLKHLQLIGNSLTNDGLKAILRNCPHLQSLDLRACFHIHLDGDLANRCSQLIKEFCRPCDCTDDYHYLTTYDDSDLDDIYAENCDVIDWFDNKTCWNANGYNGADLYEYLT